jgi:voltage-gated potassium channel
MMRAEAALALDGGGASGPAVVRGIVLLVCLSTLSFALGTIEDLRSSYGGAFDLVEAGCVLAFSVEYGLRVWVAANPWAYMATPLALVDLASVLPSWVDACLPGDNFPSLQFLRMLR